MSPLCCVADCNSIVSGPQCIRSFAFPEDEQMQTKWKTLIGRGDMEVTENTHVCCHHFAEEVIIKRYPYGGHRKKWLLKPSAVPTIFEKTEHKTRNVPYSVEDLQDRDIGNLCNNYLLQSLIQFSGSTFDRKSKTEEVFIQICRTCLCETADNDLKSNMLLPGSSHVSTVTIQEMIENLTGIKIKMEDKFPHHICNSCLKAIESARDFRIRSQQADRVLKSLIPSDENAITADNSMVEVGSLKPEQNDDFDGPSTAASIECNLCNMILSDTRELENHMAEKHPTRSKGKVFKCGLCTKEYHFRNALHDHMIITHIQKREPKCTICFKKFRSNSNLERHKKRVCVPPDAVTCRLKNGPAVVKLNYFKDKEIPEEAIQIEITNISCSLCDETFELEIDFLNHFSLHKSKQCPLCKNVFSQVMVLEGHLWTHGSETPFVCPLCSRGLKTISGLRRHIKDHAKRKEFDITSTAFHDPESNDGISCESIKPEIYVDCIIKEESDLDIVASTSKSSMSGWVNVNTDGCEVAASNLHSQEMKPAFLSDSSIKQEAIEDDEAVVTITNEPLSDNEPQSFDQPKQNSTEFQPVDSDRFACAVSDCNLKFKYFREMINHYSTRHFVGPPPFKCPVCSVSFTKKPEIRSHIRSHLKCEYSCPHCPKVYCDLRELNKHLPMHTGERPFKCPKCPKMFRHQGTRRVHLKTHNICKEFKCSICFKEFFSKNGLFLHKKSHEIIKELQCQFCNKQFPTKGRLQKHQIGLCRFRKKE